MSHLLRSARNSKHNPFTRLLPASRLWWACVATGLLWQSAWAFPFQDLHVPFTQPDGTKIEVVGWGDEFAAVFETLDGFTVVFDPGLRAYCFAQPAADGTLASTGVQVHQADAAAMGLSKHLRMSPAARKQQVIDRWQRWDAALEVQKRWTEQKAAFRAYDAAIKAGGPELGPPGFTTTGLKVGLTILIDFSDATATVPQAEIINFCNGDSYTGYGNNGSVKKYYQDNSNGLLTYTNVVTIYIRAPQPKTYYNDTTVDCGIEGRKLITDAINTMKALPNYTTDILPLFNALTVDTSSRVAACNVFFAGANSGVWSYGLWPHSWSLSSALALGNGKYVYKYQITNIGTSLAIGTFCHENGHMLCGFPDIYDYDYDSTGGAGVFCLMNSGGSGGNPAQVCAYLKRAAGWATTIDLNSSSTTVATLTATAGTNFNHFYRYQKPGVATEYFLAECRNNSGRDSRLPTSGIAIWHIDELGDRDNQSLTPNTSHLNYEVTLVQADNLWHFENNANGGDASDLYYSGNTAAAYANILSDVSTPSAHWWDGSASGLNFHDFTTRAATMSFMVGYADTPPQITAEPTDRTVVAYHATTFTVSAIGSPPLTYQWYFQSAPIGGATGTSYTIASAQMTDAGGYYAVVTNLLGQATSRVATLTVTPGISLADALDTTNLTWSTGGNGTWEGETDTTHDTVDAAQSGTITHSQQSWMETTIINGPGTISFWWKVSSESGYDFLEFYLDSVLQSGRISGTVDWQQKSNAIPSGSHVVRWRYTKDSSVSSGQDRGWVDQVTFVPGPTTDVTLAVAVNAPDLPWTTGGTANWSGQTNVNHDGFAAGQSGSITDSQESWMQTTVTNGPGTLSFWWKVSCESGYDFLEFYLDSVLQSGRISGEIDWQQRSFTLGSGTHTLRWRYAKDISLSAGQDHGWVDQVSFVAEVIAQATLSLPRYVAGQFQCNVTGTAGATYVMQGSPDLVNWTPIATNTAPFTFTDPNAGSSSIRFYRARSGL